MTIIKLFFSKATRYVELTLCQASDSNKILSQHVTVPSKNVWNEQYNPGVHVRHVPQDSTCKSNPGVGGIFFLSSSQFLFHLIIATIG